MCRPLSVSCPHSHCYQGTPLFIARAVEQTGPVPPPPDAAVVPRIPDSPDRYAEVHPDRVKKFPNSEKRRLFDPEQVGDESQKSQPKRWRHELEHDAESVFWLLLYWAMVVQPEKHPKEKIDAEYWVQLNGYHGARQR